ncbi:MAG TPA: hypothetical protein VGV93_00145 [Acidimicrobiales bacterium]|nr:hypothetical protein [Acidimicrobiales bacterium]
MIPRGTGRRVLTLIPAVILVAACGSGAGSSAGNQTRTVQVDYNHDAFATSLFENYPRRVQVRPGDTVEFQQDWTGEPHSVTMGTLVDEKIKPVLDLLNRIETTGELPEGEPSEFMTFGEALPYALGETGMVQNAAQPCYVDKEQFSGTYPGDESTPCPKTAQPPFNGRQAIYNSGVIPFEGVDGNTFRVKLSDDVPAGTYTYYCNVHGPLQYGQIEVLPPGSDIPSQAEVDRRALEEQRVVLEPMERSFNAATAGEVVEGGDPGSGFSIDAGQARIVGVPTPFFENNRFVHGIINEFVPRSFTSRVGEKVTWTFVAGHTLSFNVPEYFPVFTVAPDGTRTLNDQAEEPIGWPGPPPPDEGEGGGHDDMSGPPMPVQVDAGTWDGTGFRSTGLAFSDQDTFSVTFTRPGNYAYACLIHPKMVGTLVVED